jgi:hypothetical protein
MVIVFSFFHFFLDKKVEQKVKDGAIAPRARPAHAQGKSHYNLGSHYDSKVAAQ